MLGCYKLSILWANLLWSTHRFPDEWSSLGSWEVLLIAGNYFETQIWKVHCFDPSYSLGRIFSITWLLTWWDLRVTIFVLVTQFGLTQHMGRSSIIFRRCMTSQSELFMCRHFLQPQSRRKKMRKKKRRVQFKQQKRYLTILLSYLFYHHTYAVLILLWYQKSLILEVKVDGFP